MDKLAEAHVDLHHSIEWSNKNVKCPAALKTALYDG